MSGWIKLHRGLADHWLWDFSSPEKSMAWIDLLMMARHSDGTIMLKGRPVNIKAGQVALSQLSLQKRWKWSQNKVKRFIKLLENERMISFTANDLTTIITINNYAAYQSKEKDGGRPNELPDGRAVERIADDQSNEDIRREEGKERKNGKNLKDTSPSAPDWSDDYIDAFMSAYPKKVDKKKTIERLKKMIKAKPDRQHFVMILERVRAKALVDDKRFFASPDRYLKDELWDDEIITKGNTNGPSGSGKISLAERQAADTKAALALIAAGDAGDGYVDSDGSIVSEQVGDGRGPTDERGRLL